jgi:hypothetical protein
MTDAGSSRVAITYLNDKTRPYDVSMNVRSFKRCGLAKC